MQCGCSGSDFLSQFKRPESEDSASPVKRNVGQTEQQKKSRGEYARRVRDERALSGICVSCGKAPPDTGLECLKCKDKKRVYSQKAYAKKVAGKLAASGFSVPPDLSAEDILKLAETEREATKKKREEAAYLLPDCNWSAILCRERVAAGKCPFCGDYAAIGRQFCNSCHQKNKQSKERYISQGLCISCGQAKDTELRVCSVCHEKQKAIKRQFTKDLRDKVFEGYGGYKCNCCGESNPHFLQIDHVYNDGNKHRKKIGSGNAFYRDIIEKGFPDCFQVLCSNCNWGKRINGVCPHKWECSKPTPTGDVNENTG